MLPYYTPYTVTDVIVIVYVPAYDATFIALNLYSPVFESMLAKYAS